MENQSATEKAIEEMLEETRDTALQHLRVWFYNLEPDTELEALQTLVDELIPGAFTISIQRG